MAGISINLAGNFGKLDELKDKAHKTAGSIKAAFGSKLGKQMFAGISVAGAAAFAGIIASVKTAIDAGGELSDMMAKTGASGKNLLILEKAFTNAGLSANEVGSSLARMQKALAGVNEDGQPTNQIFARLGLSVQELMAMDPAEALMKIGDSISRIPDPANRAAAAMELFGRSGANLNVVFTDSAALETAKTQLGGLADILPGMSVDADFVSDAFGSLDDKSKQLGAGIASELMPNLLQVAKWMNETDFSDLGREIGSEAQTIGEFFTALGKGMGFVASQAPGFEKAVWVIKKLASLNPTEGKALPMIPGISIGADGKAIVEEPPTPPTPPKPEAFNFFEADREKTRNDREKKDAAAAEAKAAADAKAAAEKDKSRAAAAEEYRLEKDMLAARIRGDSDRLAKLEREKAIREEMKRLESAGFTSAEARKPAEAKVDAEKEASEVEAKRQAEADEKQRRQESVAGKLNSTRDHLDNLQYQSSIGAISSMQRVGGGGGAVASGLDYQRQVADLQREANGYLKELIAISREPLD